MSLERESHYDEKTIQRIVSLLEAAKQTLNDEYRVYVVKNRVYMLMYYGQTYGVEYNNNNNRELIHFTMTPLDASVKCFETKLEAQKIIRRIANELSLRCIYKKWRGEFDYDATRRYWSEFQCSTNFVLIKE